MTWFTVGAFLALGMLVANSAFVIARRKRVPAEAPQPPRLKQKIRISTVVAISLMVTAWVAGLGAPVFWPGTALGDFMSNTLNLVAYFTWCGIAYVVFHTAWHLITSRFPRRNGGAV